MEDNTVFTEDESLWTKEKWEEQAPHMLARAKKEHEEYEKIRKDGLRFLKTVRGTDAQGRLMADESFLLLKGSHIATSELACILPSVHAERENAIAAGLVKDFVLQEDILFRGLSHACAFCVGAQGDGNRWRTLDGETRDSLSHTDETEENEYQYNCLHYDLSYEDMLEEDRVIKLILQAYEEQEEDLPEEDIPEEPEGNEESEEFEELEEYDLLPIESDLKKLSLHDFNRKYGTHINAKVKKAVMQFLKD